VTEPYERIPKAIGPLEEQSKDDAYKAGYAAHGKANSASTGSPPLTRKGFGSRATFFTDDIPSEFVHGRDKCVRRRVA
jgi:hypothetical protein